jgi:hypothetical protein
LQNTPHSIVDMSLDSSFTLAAAAIEGTTTSSAASPKIYRAKSGRRYSSIAAIQELLGVGEEMLRARTAGIRKVHPEGYRDALYSVDDFEAHPDIMFRRNAQYKVDKDGFFEEVIPTAPEEESAESSIELWATVDAFWRSLPPEITDSTTRQAVLLQAQMHCEGRPSVDTKGRTTSKIYRVSDLQQKALAVFHLEKVVDPYKTFYLDEDGEKWAGKRHWLRVKRVTNRALDNGVKKEFGSWDNVPFETGRNTIMRAGKMILAKKMPLYKEEVIDKILAYILQAERLVHKGVYRLMDETREKVVAIYKTSKALAEEIPVQAETIQRKLLRSECPRLGDAVHRHNGATTTVFELGFARQVFKTQIEVVVETDEEGEYIHELGRREEARCVNTSAYCEERGHIGIGALQTLIREHGILRLRRRDIRTNHIVYLYPEKELDRISGYNDL